jgi:hypothetical protein
VDSFYTALDKNGASVENRTLHGHTASALFTLAHYLPHMGAAGNHRCSKGRLSMWDKGRQSSACYGDY